VISETLSINNVSPNVRASTVWWFVNLIEHLTSKSAYLLLPYYQQTKRTISLQSGSICIREHDNTTKRMNASEQQHSLEQCYSLVLIVWYVSKMLKIIFNFCIDHVCLQFLIILCTKFDNGIRPITSNRLIQHNLLQEHHFLGKLLRSVVWSSSACTPWEMSLKRKCNRYV